MICIKTAYYPKRKTKNPTQWFGYIRSKLKESRGLEKHRTDA